MAGEPVAWGSLASGGVVKLEPGVVVELARTCARAFDGVLGARKIVADVVELAPFSVLPSGTDLARKMSARGGEVRDFLDRHVEILNEMADTFVAAGKAFDGAEQDSIAELDKIRMPTEPGGQWSSPAPQLLSNTDWPTGIAQDPRYGYYQALSGSNGVSEYHPASIDQGNAHSMDLPSICALHDSIDPSKVRYASDVWGWMSREMTAAFGGFRERLEAVKSMWLGAGAAKATEATQLYIDDSDMLAYQMGTMSSNLFCASAWLYQTWQTTPSSSQFSTVESQRQALKDPTYLQDLRNNVNQHYWGVRTSVTEHVSTLTGTYPPGFSTGVVSADTKIPMFVAPRSPVSGTIRDEDRRRGGPTGGGPGGGVPTGRLGPGISPAGLNGSGAPSGAPANSPGAGDPSGNPLSALSGLGQQAGNALQQAGTAGKPQGAGTPPSMMSASAKPSGPGGGSGLGASGLGAGKEPAQQLNKFPRAGALGPMAAGAGLSAARAGSVPMGGTPGTPGATGAAGQNAGQGERARKRPSYLESDEHIDEAMGTPQVVSRPVVDQ
ncbi:hypothetical protein [Nocardia lijiangensis]|uniref:hypothetical protein n=1 Tax=Nocardia lijiangensis TaxID=299618 RepID=UPI003D7660D3